MKKDNTNMTVDTELTQMVLAEIKFNYGYTPSVEIQNEILERKEYEISKEYGRKVILGRVGELPPLRLTKAPMTPTVPTVPTVTETKYDAVELYLGKNYNSATLYKNGEKVKRVIGERMSNKRFCDNLYKGYLSGAEKVTSNKNAQGYKFIIVKDEETVDEIVKEFENSFA